MDILDHVIDNLHERLEDPHARAVFVLPEFVRRMVDRGQTGEKAGQGFYKRIKNAAGESEILTLDPATLDYRPRSRRRSVDRGRQGDRRRGRADPHPVPQQGQSGHAPPRHPCAVARLHRTGGAGHRTLRGRRGPCDAMGFRLGAGPFETADAIGIREVLDAAASAKASAFAEATADGRRPKLRRRRSDGDGCRPATGDF